MEAEMFQRNSIGLITKILTPVALVGLIISSGCSSKTTEMQSHWSTESIKVDGQSEDWADTPLTCFKDSQVSLGLRNDAENLYILFRFKNETWARLIARGGMTLWLDNMGKKKKDFGIRYTGGPSPSQLQQSGEGRFRDRLTPEQQERMLERHAEMAKQVTIIDKQADKEISVPADGSQGPAASFAYEQGFYSYEFKIPLQGREDNCYAIGAQAGQTVGLGLEWGGMDAQRQMRQERGRGMRDGGRRPGGMGPGQGGRRPGGRGRGQGDRAGGSRRQLLEKQKIWVKILLVSPQKEQGKDLKSISSQTYYTISLGSEY